MRIAAAVTMAILGMNVGAGQSLQDGSRVTVCLVDFGHTFVLNQATATASKMYSAIGVTLDWQSNSRICKTAEVIHIELTDCTPATLLPGALAYALPYEGIHIRVFFDRLKKTVEPRLLPDLLAHVLVHEIGHILQGIGQHSETGVMKAHWTPEDYSLMAVRYLPFTEGDVSLIHTGIEKRAARILAANISVRAGSSK